MIIIKVILIVLAIIYGLSYTMAFHRLLLKRTWYRWVVNSIIFPYWGVVFKNKSIVEKEKIYTDWLIEKRWYLNFWFGKKIKKKLGNDILKARAN